MNERAAACLTGKDRLIVALDVPTHEQALAVVDALDNVSFFKVGLELFLAGDLLGFIQKIQEKRSGEGGVFVDLKLSGDIGNTISRFVCASQALNVKFITLVESVPYALTVATIKAALDARGAHQRDPRLLMVPLLSSLDSVDLGGADATAHILTRGKKLLDDGCDGLIVSGTAIENCRKRFPDAVIVSPGIRPASASADDHKRCATPRDAIRRGADYLVVGRPILNVPGGDRRGAAQKIIDEVDEALEKLPVSV